MVKVVSFINLKGGVGKSISSSSIATLFAQSGYKTLIIDCDKQSNTTQYLNRYSEDMHSMYHVFNGEKSIYNIIRQTDIKNLDIAPATIEIVKLKEKHFDGRLGFLNEQIEKLDYDFIIIDCPPDLNTIVDNVLIATTDVLVPIKVDNFALFGFGYLMEKIQEIKQLYNPNLEFTGAFITMDKARTKVSKEAKEQLTQHLQTKLFRTFIRDNSTVVTSTFYQKPIVVFDKSSNAARDYNNLALEILEKLLGGK